MRAIGVDRRVAERRPFGQPISSTLAIAFGLERHLDQRAGPAAMPFGVDELGVGQQAEQGVAIVAARLAQGAQHGLLEGRTRDEVQRDEAFRPVIGAQRLFENSRKPCQAGSFSQRSRSPVPKPRSPKVFFSSLVR